MCICVCMNPKTFIHTFDEYMLLFTVTANGNPLKKRKLGKVRNENHIVGQV